MRMRDERQRKRLQEARTSLGCVPVDSNRSATTLKMTISVSSWASCSVGSMAAPRFLLSRSQMAAG